MTFSKYVAAAAALSLATAPAMAQSAPARSSAPAEAQSEIGGQAGIFVLFALLAIVIGFIATDDGGDDDPVSA